MDDGVETGAVLAHFGAIAEDAAAEGRPVEGPTFSVGTIFGHVGTRGEEEVGGGGTEVGDDGVVAGSSRFDDFAGEKVGVDDGEVVGRGGEEGGDG